MTTPPGAPPLVAATEAEKETEVVRSQQSIIRSATHRTPCLVQIYPTDTSVGRLHVLDRPLTLGRDAGCELCLEEGEVSRYHARVMPRDGAYFVVDLRSTNGTFVNDAPVRFWKLRDGDYLRVGRHIYRFLASGNIEADYHEEIYRLTVTDALTGVHNKRHLMEFLERELVRAVRHQRPLALVLFDIDHFKSINDRHGHLAGDAVLRGLATCLRQDIRRDELFARYGGEEFALVLPETTRAKALPLAERLRERAAAEGFEWKGTPLAVTISLGVTATDGSESLTPADFLARADENLYRAKQQGRNRVVA